MRHYPGALDLGERVPMVTQEVPGTDPRTSWLDPGIGEWWIEPLSCYYDRLFPAPPAPEDWTPHNRGGVRPVSGAGNIGVGKWVIVPEGDGLRSKFFYGNGPDSPASPMMQYFATLDGTPWADPHSTLLPGQLVQLWRLDPRMTVRLVLDHRTPEAGRFEWAVYAPATDGRLFACTSWDATAPARHNLQVFRKHLGPIYNRDGAGAPEAVDFTGGLPACIADSDPMFGTWLIDREASSFLRAGQDVPEIRPAAIGRQKIRFERRGDWVVRKVYSSLDSSDADCVTRWRFDANDYPAGGGTSAAWWLIDPLVFIGRGRNGGTTRDWSLHAISDDGSMLALTSWDEATPHNRDIEVYRKTSTS